MTKTSKAAAAVKARKEALEKALPRQITVMGRVFDVQISNLKGADGDCLIAESRIRIHQAQSLESAKATLWHEVIHAALGISGLNELLTDSLEEAIVRCFEHSFSDVVDLNKIAVVRNNLTERVE